MAYLDTWYVRYRIVHYIEPSLKMTALDGPTVMKTCQAPFMVKGLSSRLAAVNSIPRLWHAHRVRHVVRMRSGDIAAHPWGEPIC